MRWIKCTGNCWVNLRHVVQVHVVQDRDGWRHLALFTEHGHFETTPQREPLDLTWLTEDRGKISV